MKIKIKACSDIFFVLLYKLALDYMYVKIQVPLFGYNGFVYDSNTLRFVIGWVIYLLVYLIISTEESDTSSLFIYVVFFVSITPFITLYQFDAVCGFWMVLSQCVCLLYINFILLFGRKRSIKSFELAGINYKSNKLRLVVFVLILAYFAITVARFGIPNIRNLLFEEVYNTRSSANLSTIQSIVQNAICRIICPLSMLVAFREKKWIPFAILVVIQVYTYAITGFKTYLFIPVVLIGLQFMPKLNLRKTIVRGLPIAVIAVVIVYLLSHSSMAYAVLGNRVFFLPAKIKYAYFDYFSNHDFVYFTQNSISKIFGVTSNYSTNIFNLIGDYYFNKSNMWANTGFMADAYANLGLVGMALMGTVIGVVLNILFRQLRSVPDDLQKELQAVFVTFYISLNDGATISVLVSGGMLLAVLIVCYVKFTDKQVVSNNDLLNCTR